MARAGVAVLHDVLANSLPDSFFPGPMPFSAGDGSSVQVLSSVQVRPPSSSARMDGVAALCMFAPAIQTRADSGTARARPRAQGKGTTALWRPRWLEFPELVVRADVVVRGPAPEAALGHFAALLESDLADLVDVSGPLGAGAFSRLLPPSLLGDAVAAVQAATTG
jgi:hypothetical protein